MSDAMERPFPSFLDMDMPAGEPTEFRARRGAPLPEGQAVGTREEAVAALKTVYVDM